jgi:hypothetical protein
MKTLLQALPLLLIVLILGAITAALDAMFW